MQAYVAWQVPDDPDHIRQFLRAVRNQPEIAAEQLRSFVGSSLEIAASSFDLSSLVNTDPQKIHLGQFEGQLRDRLDEQALNVYGSHDPPSRHRAFDPSGRDVEGHGGTDESRAGNSRSGTICRRPARSQRNHLQRVSRCTRPRRQAKADAAGIEAKARVEAADIYGKAYSSDPELYTLLRSLDTLDQVIDGNTRLILRTDAAPFNVLVDGPNGTVGTPAASEPAKAK